jgi:hypothetical protein
MEKYISFKESEIKEALQSILNTIQRISSHHQSKTEFSYELTRIKDKVKSFNVL